MNYLLRLRSMRWYSEQQGSEQLFKSEHGKQVDDSDKLEKQIFSVIDKIPLFFIPS